MCPKKEKATDYQWLLSGRQDCLRKNSFRLYISLSFSWQFKIEWVDFCSAILSGGVDYIKKLALRARAF